MKQKNVAIVVASCALILAVIPFGMIDSLGSLNVRAFSARIDFERSHNYALADGSISDAELIRLAQAKSEFDGKASSMYAAKRKTQSITIAVLSLTTLLAMWSIFANWGFPKRRKEKLGKVRAAVSAVPVLVNVIVWFVTFAAINGASYL